MKPTAIWIFPKRCLPSAVTTDRKSPYTLEEVLRYAKSQGFYLNDQFEVVNDLFIYDDASTTRDQLVYWRAYDPDATLKEPGTRFSSPCWICPRKY